MTTYPQSKDATIITDIASGNINHFDRPVIEWTDEEIEKQRDALESWEQEAADLEGTISTIFGAAEQFGDVNVGFTPTSGLSLTLENINEVIF